MNDPTNYQKQNPRYNYSIIMLNLIMLKLKGVR